MKSWKLGPNLEKLVYALLTVRVAFGIYRAFLPPNNPHAHRQTDTLAVSLRYFSRWFIEDDAKMPLLPAVLNAGDTSGIMRMEFPFVNLLGAPGFFAGPHTGQAMACLIIFAFHALLLLANIRIWRDTKICGIPMRLALLLLPIFSLTDQYFTRYMPDITALLLVLSAIGLSWEKPRFCFSVALASLGLLIKPPAVAMFGLLLAQGNLWRVIRQNLLWVGAALVAPVLYYTVGLRWIGQYQEMEELFKVGLHPPWVNLTSFFSFPKRLVELLLNRAMPSGILAIVAFAILWAKKAERTTKGYGILWLILFAQLLLVAALDGDHAYTHEYYFLAMAPVFTLIFVGFWQNVAPYWLRYLLALLIVGRLVDVIATETRAAGTKKSFDIDLMYQECKEIIAESPDVPWQEGEPFRSSNEIFPRLGLCFGEIQNSQLAAYGFYYAADTLPPGCEIKLAKTQVVLARCQ